MSCKNCNATDVKYVYSFGGDNSEGNESMRALLGGKGANLAGMAALGLPVPPGFTITTEACAEFGKIGKEALFAKIAPQVDAACRRDGSSLESRNSLAILVQLVQPCGEYSDDK